MREHPYRIRSQCLTPSRPSTCNSATFHTTSTGYLRVADAACQLTTCAAMAATCISTSVDWSYLAVCKADEACSAAPAHQHYHLPRKRAMASPSAVGEGPISSFRDLPGEPTNTSTSFLEKGSALLQRFYPIKQIHQHVCAFHLYGYDMRRQVEAHHYCSHYNEEVRQCLLFDSDHENARLIGVEYMISDKLFNGLPDEEKKLWHSHVYEVKSGMLIGPGLPEVAETAEMAKVATTYGKVFHFWQFDKGDTLPLGPPQLMMSFTADGQLDPKLAQTFETRYDFSMQHKREQRKDITGPEGGIHPLADYWKTGKGLAPSIREVDLPSSPPKVGATTDTEHRWASAV